jgi:anti-sigma factor RsiW
MSLTRETMEELMQYADGELDADARARVEALLKTSEEARGVVDAMGVLGDVVRDGAEARAAETAAADEIADAVMKAIETGVRSAGRGEVVPLAKARRSRAGMTSAVVAALALAAGVLLFVTGRSPAPVAREEVFGSAAPQLSASSESEAPSADPEGLAQAEGPGVDLEEVRSIRNKVNVFFTPTADSAKASVVVWIDDRHGGP